jgi:two-component system response regulator AtoC
VAAVRDLDSRNGVFLNGRRVQSSPLVAGDVLRCGEWVGIVGPHGGCELFGEIAQGWFGGRALRESAAPALHAPSDLPILIQGETGTGKEGLARAVHAWSRRTGPLISVNCATLPLQLAESQLFGHRKGAFTGADQAQPGFFRSAHGGSLFLDEILELPLSLQPKLLRVVEQQEVIPVGEAAAVPIDVKVIAAAQEPLADAVRAGRFRADLFARLNGLTLTVPPLRARREDILPLFRLFLRRFSGPAFPEPDHRAVEALCLHDWPMNVRELGQLARQLLAVHLPEQLRATLPEETQPTPKREWRRTSDETECARLLQAMAEHGGSVAKAASAIGMQRSRAYRLLAAHSDSARKQG